MFGTVFRLEGLFGKAEHPHQHRGLDSFLTGLTLTLALSREATLCL